MFLEYPGDAYAGTREMQYQFMLGGSLLVAPVYKNVAADDRRIPHGHMASVGDMVDYTVRCIFLRLVADIFPVVLVRRVFAGSEGNRGNRVCEPDKGCKSRA